METPSLNINYTKNSYSHKDVLSAFRETSEKDLTIHQGMSVQEISEVVTERIMNIVKEQFEATKVQFELKEKNNTSK